MRHAAVMVDIEGTHKVIPLDEDVRNTYSIYYLNIYIFI